MSILERKHCMGAKECKASLKSTHVSKGKNVFKVMKGIKNG